MPQPDPLKELIELLEKWRAVIRWHRDEKGHDRCWMSDPALYSVILGRPFPQLPDTETCLVRCKHYHRCRSAPQAPPAQETLSGDLDADLKIMSIEKLKAEQREIRIATLIHRYLSDLGFLRARGDCELYAVLPEKVLPDQTLPPWGEFRPACREFIASGPDLARLYPKKS